MSLSRKIPTLEERLANAQTALVNTLNTPEILEQFTLVGYDSNRIGNGKQKHSNVMNLIANQKKEYGDKYAATEKLQNARAVANKAYKRRFKMAKIVLDETSAIEALQLKGARKESYSGWLQQTTIFYTNLLNNPAYINKMSSNGTTAEVLEQELQLVKAVETALNEQKIETGEAQAATVERDKAIDDLFDWMSDFYEFADIALEDFPQWKEKLGILER